MTPSWHSLLIGGVILFLFADKFHFIVDVFQDLWLGSMVYYVLSVFCQVLYLLIFGISTDGDSFWRLDEQLKCCLVAVCQCICYSHFMLNVNKPHTLGSSLCVNTHTHTHRHKSQPMTAQKAVPTDTGSRTGAVIS